MGNRDIIPSHMAGIPYDDGGKLTNHSLRMGEVQAVYPPSHKKNISKRAHEHDVLVTHYDNGSPIHKVYSHCYVVDIFGGVADTFSYTLRADKSGSRKPIKAGRGSKVLILCVNGHENNAVIIGGIKDQATTKHREEDGHNLLFRFNGVEVTINDDGELLIERQGPSEMDGQLREGVDAATTGTTVMFLKNGNVSIADAVKDGDDVVEKNIILLNHQDNKIEITGDSEINVNSKKVTMGSADATEPFVLGNKWASLMSDLIDTIGQLTVFTAEGPSGPVINTPAFMQIKARLNSILSETTFSK